MNLGPSFYLLGSMCLLCILAMIFLSTKRGKKWLDSLD